MHSFGRQTWLSSTYLCHHLGGSAAVEIALSSTNSITRLAMVALTDEREHFRHNYLFKTKGQTNPVSVSMYSIQSKLP